MSELLTPPEDWARHARALRRLARELVGDPEEREELVQSTLAAALERPPRVLSLSWLVTVLTHRARDLARRRARQGPARELPELESSWPDASALAQRLELQNELGQALQELGEPYQSTLYLRYFEELTPSAIAARSGLSVKTVKTRLERGLALLRQRLERRHGPGNRALLVLLQPLAEGASILMAKKIALAVLVLVVLAGLWGALRTRAGEEPGRVQGDAPALASAPTIEEPPALALPPASEAREPEVAASIASAPAAASAAGSLRVHVLWDDGTPAAGIVLNLRSRPEVPRFPQRGLGRALTDDAGEALFAELAPGKVGVSADRGAMRTVQVVAGEERALELRLAPGLDVAGRVLDEHEAPVAGATIWLSSGYADWLAMHDVGTSDAAGRFHLRAIPPEQSLGASAAGRAPSALVDLEMSDVSSSPVEIVLRLVEAGADLHGRVVDARGEPVPRAGVCVGNARYPEMRSDGTRAELWAPRTALCDEAGRFRFTGLTPGVQPIAVRAPRAPLWTASVELRAGAAAELTVTLATGVVLAGTVRDARGAPLAQAFVRAFPAPLAPDFLGLGQYDDPSVFGAPITTSDAQGRYRLEQVAPGAVHAYASPPRPKSSRGSEAHAEAVLQAPAGATLEWNPVIEPGRTIRGRVLYADRQPMARTFVTALEAGKERARVLETGEDGSFAFHNLPASTFRVEVPLTSALRSEQPLFAAEVVPDGPELELVASAASPADAPSARVRGRFIDPTRRFGRPLAAMLEGGPGVGFFPSRSEDGEFEFTGVPAGRYTLLGWWGEREVYSGQAFELRSGQGIDLGRLEVGAGATLTLNLRRAAGMERARVQGHLRAGGRRGDQRLDFGVGDELTLPDLTVGEYVVTLYSGSEAAQVQRVVTLNADLRLELPVRACAMREVEIGLAPGAKGGELELTIRGEDGSIDVEERYPGAWDAGAPFRMTFALSVGKHTLSARASDGSSASAEIVVEAAGSSAPKLELVLKR